MLASQAPEDIVSQAQEPKIIKKRTKERENTKIEI